MKQSQLWLLALLTVLTFVAANSATAEEGAGHLTGSWELGMSGINTDDNATRVNEYSSVNASDGVALAPKLNLEFDKAGFILGVESETMGPRDQKHALSIDAMRVFRLDSSLTVLEHHKDHETLDQLGATMKNSTGGGQPTVMTDKTLADVIAAGGAASIGGGSVVGYNPATAYAQEVDNNYVITRREWKNEAELTIPQLPNITIHAGARIETREGMEQAIGLSKCDSCHITAKGKDIDERTEEFTVGATGKFGLLTVDYEYLTRNFEEDSGYVSRWYDDAAAKFDNRLLYDNGDFNFAKTPDSEKETHKLKARLDLPRNTTISASYVKSNVESTKNELQDPWYTLLNGNTLETEYESFGAKVATKLGNKLSLSFRGSTYEIDASNNAMYFADRQSYLGIMDFDNDATDEWVSAEERETTNFGIDAVYRLAKATTLRLGYEYEKIDRDEKTLGETETNTFKIALKTRINNTLSGRISYQYQDIDDPFAGDDATGIAQVNGSTNPAYPGLAWLETIDYINQDSNTASTVFYWNSVYSNRGFDATNQPDTVHEGKISTTWSPSANMAATFFMRARYEENDAVKYEQTTLVPGVSFWYAPNDKLNLTMSYTFNNQDTENRACVGWYHG